jgi:hypothetical protein
MTKPSTSIHLRNVGVDFPVFNASALSLKNRLLSWETVGVKRWLISFSASLLFPYVHQPLHDY